MKVKNNFLLIILLVFEFNCLKATNVSGNVFGHWTLSGSPYNVINNINIPADSTLVIDAGVQIIFIDNYKLVVNGNLLASGNQNDSIVFSAPNTIPGFSGIRFETTSASQDSSIFEYCVFYNARAGSALTPAPGNYGGAFFANEFGKIRIQHCNFRNNITFGAGGAISCYSHSNILILDNTFINNRAGVAGSTIATGGAIHSSIQSNIVVKRNHFTKNVATNGGSAFYSSACNIQFYENLVDSNGRIPVYCTSNGDANIEQNIIVNNVSSNSNGPALLCSMNGNVYILNNEIAYNKNDVAALSGISNGGGLSVKNAAKAIIAYNNIHHNVIDRQTNQSMLKGAGIDADINGDTLLIINNKIFNNTILKYGFGGGISVTKGIVANNLICNNAAYDITALYGEGGGIYATDSVILTNNTIANNYSFLKGGGVYFNGGNSVKLYNNIVYGNLTHATAGHGDQLYCFNGTITPIVNNNFNASNCNIQGGYAAIAYSYVNLQGTTYTNNIDTMPLFVNPTLLTADSADASLADWDLLPSSMCINNGDSIYATSNTDIAGNDRIFDVNIDIGAYEYQSIIGPPVTASFIIGDICLNALVSPLNTSTNATSYIWDMPGGTPSTSTDQYPLFIYQAPGTYNITLIAINASGADTLTQSINVYPPPLVNAGADVGICLGSSVTLSAVGLGSFSYNWSPAATLSTPNQSQTIATPGSSTDYVVTVFDAYCSASDTVTVMVWPLPPAPVISQTGNVLQATTGYPAYQWYFNNVAKSGAVTDTLNAVNAGSYTVDVIDTNGCTANSVPFVFTPVGLTDNNNFNISIYPNPASTELTVSVPYDGSLIQVFIEDVKGSLILSENIQSNNHVIKIQDLKTGLYFIRILNNAGIIRNKFIKN